MDPLKALAQVKNLQASTENLQELADKEETKLNQAKEARASENTNTDTEKPGEKPSTSESSGPTINPGLKAHGVDRKGAIDTEANTRRIELENTMVSNYMASKTESPE